MIAPIKDKLIVTNKFGAKGYGYFGKHAGVDLRAKIDTSLFAPDDGRITEAYIGTKGIRVLSMRIGNKEHRFLHLSKFRVKVGQIVKKGQQIGNTGDTGGVAAHLHWDIRKAGTAWTHSFSDYYDPIKLLNAKPPNKILKPVYYLVRKGDFLSRIAARFKLSLKQILRLNPEVKNPNKISIKQKLRVK